MKTTPFRAVMIGTLIIFSVVACSTATETMEEPRPTEVVVPTATRATIEEIESRFPQAQIVNDEGGPTFVTGQVEYTYPFFTVGVAEPLVILEDQAGFVDRDRDFLFPVESQILGQITSDFFTSPFTYSMSLPAIPRGTLRDVDNDGDDNEGVMIFAVAYWTNIWGDPYLEKRDQGGGGWSSAYASTLVSDDRDNYLEVYGGKYLVYASDDQQGFPSGFGSDDKLFTEDDPIVQIPAGWTVVDLDQVPFGFDRSREVTLDLFEPESLALDDFSELSYLEAFDAMVEKLRLEYAFTEFKGIDWDELVETFRPRFENARTPTSYALTLRDFLWSIPDGHVGMDISLLIDQFRYEVIGGLGIAILELDEGTILVNFLQEGSPADRAGLQFGAEILTMNGVPISEVIDATVPWSSPFSTPQAERLEQLRFATRFPTDTEVELSYKNPGGAVRTASMVTEIELDSYFSSPYFIEPSGFELPVEYEILDNGLGYVQIFSFFDNELLSIQIWERLMQELNENGIPGLIIDLRSNGGGSGYLADQMAAYFFSEELEVGTSSVYDPSIGDFYSDPGDTQRLYPPRDELIYRGEVVVILGPSCASACEFFAYDLTQQSRVTIVGMYPSAGLGGGIESFKMPESIDVQFTIGRAVDMQGNIHIEGQGVAPDIRVSNTIETFNAFYLNSEDPVLDAAIQSLLGP
jgi:C-terminal processing protease CtpA/Prc